MLVHPECGSYVRRALELHVPLTTITVGLIVIVVVCYLFTCDRAFLLQAAVSSRVARTIIPTLQVTFISRACNDATRCSMLCLSCDAVRYRGKFVN